MDLALTHFIQEPFRTEPYSLFPEFLERTAPAVLLSGGVSEPLHLQECFF